MYELTKAVVELDHESVPSMVKDELAQGILVEEVIEKCRQGMEVIGIKFSEGEYYLPELIMAGEIFNSVLEIIRPVLAEADANTVGKIVLATVKDDIHDIGKNVFKGFAEANGFAVHDLGVDVAPEAIIDAIKNEKPDIVGLSCLLTSAFDSIENTILKINEAGVRDQVKIVIGGAPVSEDLKKWSGADAASRSAAEGVKLCKELMNGEGR
ncbi:MAG TPA: cobalamin-binding protein [Peptococcaceae bacterium]|jgi:methylmalonyl-CoA mutase cobalamin-binding domain/chain|nr:cobalamin-binding protein [Peptococcaceae bacterium]